MQIIEFAGLSNRPNPGSKLALYMDTDTGVMYRWTGAAYQAVNFSADGTYIPDPTGSNPYGFALLPLDASGNIIANVNHRTGHLADLLTLAGGDGEISVADDADAFVAHTGTALEARAFYRSSKIAELHVHGTIASLVGGTASVVDLASKTVDYGGMTVDLANNKFQPPKGTKYVKGTIYVTVTDADVTAGTKFTAYIDYYISGFGWSYLVGMELFVKNPVAYLQASGDTIVMHGVSTVDSSALFDQSPSTDEGFIQIRILHGDGVDAYANVEVSAVFEFFGPN